MAVALFITPYSFSYNHASSPTIRYSRRVNIGPSGRPPSKCMCR